MNITIELKKSWVRIISRWFIPYNLSHCCWKSQIAEFGPKNCRKGVTEIRSEKMVPLWWRTRTTTSLADANCIWFHSKWNRCEETVPWPSWSAARFASNNQLIRSPSRCHLSCERYWRWAPGWDETEWFGRCSVGTWSRFRYLCDSAMIACPPKTLLSLGLCRTARGQKGGYDWSRRCENWVVWEVVRWSSFAEMATFFHVWLDPRLLHSCFQK